MSQVEIKERPHFAMSDVFCVLFNLRAEERLEAERTGGDPLVTFPDVVSIASDAFMAYLRGEPVFCFGTVRSYPHTRAIFGFGSRKAWRVMPEVTKFITQLYIPSLVRQGVTRGELRLPGSALRNVAWLKSIGLEIETELPGLSMDPSDPFVQLAIHPGSKVHVHHTTTESSAGCPNRGAEEDFCTGSG